MLHDGVIVDRGTRGAIQASANPIVHTSFGARSRAWRIADAWWTSAARSGKILRGDDDT
jgi:hypothetical protein